MALPRAVCNVRKTDQPGIDSHLGGDNFLRWICQRDFGGIRSVDLNRHRTESRAKLAQRRPFQRNDRQCFEAGDGLNSGPVLGSRYRLLSALPRARTGPEKAVPSFKAL